MELSVIIVTKNEAANIAACIESVLADTKDLTTEVIVVDSRSDDATVDIARRYPVTVAQFRPEALMTSDAGRYVGTQISTGRCLCYVDGDMIMVPGWIPKAVELLENGGVAGVSGLLFRVYPGEGLSFEHRENDPLGYVHGFGGAGVYCGDAIRSVGPFNPFMRGEGERELGYRLRQTGAKLLRVEIPMVYHMEKPRTREEIDEKAGMFAGVGQILRRYPGREIFFSLLRSNKQRFAELVIGGLCVLTPVVFLALGNLLYAAIAIIPATVALIGLALWKGHRKTRLFLRSRIMNIVHIVRGVGLGLPDAREYPALYDVLATPR
jgi:glycosyltransferase involved in cell wall biosynthesis